MNRFLSTVVFAASFASLAALAACSSSDEPIEQSASGSEDLTGTTSAERPIHFESQVYVAVGASDDVIKTAIARQVKTAIGALRLPKVSLNDRAAQSNLDPSRWTRRVLTVKDPASPANTSQIQRVTFTYDDRAVVTNDLSTRTAVDFVMLADDYGRHDAPLKTDCTDDPTTDTDSLWYHYQPQSSACAARIQSELTVIAQQKQKLGSADDVIGPAEANRWFMPVTARLDPKKLPASEFSPEYDRLYGIGDSARDKVVVYAFFGVDTDENDPDDLLALEAVRFLREMLRAQPNFRPVKTLPDAMLLDLYVGGQKLSGVTYDKMFGWIIDKSGYPAEVGSDATKIADLRRQALAKLTERWIYWDLPMTVKGANGVSKDVTVEVRSFYGYEDGSAEARQHAQWRYLEAFWHGDVFLYNGHSHFGHGPLEPTMYGPQNFNGRYQIMMINSCISFNYYHQDFLGMKPGGSKNLDMVVNGLPSYVWGGGVALARMLGGLFDGTQKTYRELLTGMRLDTPWGERAYDPMRIVDGELDNTYVKATSPLTVTVRPPVY
jgi:hypothetical protein